MVRQSTLAVKVGIVLMLAIIGLIGFSLKSDGRSFLYKGYTLSAVFDAAKGIENGSSVVMAGVPIGRVKAMHFDPQTLKVTIKLEIDAENQIHNDAKASIRLKTLLGSYQVYVTPGSVAQPPLKDGEAIQTEPYKDIQDVLADLGGGGGAGPGKLFEKVEAVIDENRENIKKTTESLAGVGPKLDKLVESLTKISGDIQGGKGTVGKLTQSDELYNKINTVVTDLQNFSTKINSPDGVLAKLTGDGEWSQKLDNTVNNLDEFSENVNHGKGTVGRLVNDTALADKIEKLVDDASGAAKSLNGVVDANKGGLGDGIAHFNSIMKKIDDGTGTLGKLVNDPEVYNGVRDAVNQVRRTFEEGEEQSVMRTFMGVFFGSVI